MRHGGAPIMVVLLICMLLSYGVTLSSCGRVWWQQQRRRECASADACRGLPDDDPRCALRCVSTKCLSYLANDQAGSGGGMSAKWRELFQNCVRSEERATIVSSPSIAPLSSPSPIPSPSSTASNNHSMNNDER